MNNIKCTSLSTNFFMFLIRNNLKFTIFFQNVAHGHSHCSGTIESFNRPKPHQRNGARQMGSKSSR